ncbi:MAG: glycine--tRNA ligase subunit beta [Rhodospirillaceae bacterium]|nr:glycine--tRNA ligase subunit beta [Rhodospirillaceae bacterium]MDE0618769.1 glycine--tRNA ligase subunit beta [Rhodospirillaceae bacterium]
MPELLLELLSEEIPARMQDRARADLERLVTGGLKEAGLEHGDVWTFSTPRRIGLSVGGLPERQPDVRQERKGPRVGSPDKAIEGFLRSVGFDSLDECEVREAKGAEFWFAVIERKGAATADALGGIVTGAIRAMGWPKSMRWGGSAFQWVRPLHNILCLFDGRPVAGSFDIGGSEALAFNGTTVGHRFLAPGEIAVESAADYRAKLEKAFVLVDPDERRARIEAQAGALAASLGSSLREDRALLNEVTGLVEWPVAVAGRIDAEFMDLPPEVLITSMRSHQKYFALETADGRMAPHFIAIADMETGDGGRSVAAGNERVLRARLADAQFFWDQDLEIPLSGRVEALEGITFHAKLGTVLDKVGRIEKLAGELADLIHANRRRTTHAARLAKADLTTGMVGEFPELQGIMGRYYALEDREHPEVAEAIAEHYAPQGPSEKCPQSRVSIAVALADKIDTLATFWAIGETPTGSRDPYGLRRAALGVIRLILENNIRLPLMGMLRQAAEGALRPAIASGSLTSLNRDEGPQQAFQFIVDRLKVHLRDRGVRHDLISAVFAKGDEDDLLRLLARVDALDKLLGSDDGGNLLTAYRRAANILRIEEKKDGRSYEGAPAVCLLKMAEETDLSKALDTAAAEAERALEKGAFGEAMTALAKLREPIDQFFDKVTVNDPDPALRENRLLLLSSIRTVMDSVADFSRIEG